MPRPDYTDERGPGGGWANTLAVYPPRATDTMTRVVMAMLTAMPMTMTTRMMIMMRRMMKMSARAVR